MLVARALVLSDSLLYSNRIQIYITSCGVSAGLGESVSARVVCERICQHQVVCEKQRGGQNPTALESDLGSDFPNSKIAINNNALGCFSNYRL